MSRLPIRWRAAALALLLAGTAQAGDTVVYESASGFDDVLTALKLGIEERGLYINNIMHMGDMLERTGKDLGDTRAIFSRAESVEFCSAVLSRRMTSEDPSRIINCPFIISVYTLPERPDTTFVAHRAIPADEAAGSPAMAEVAAMLRGLAEGAVNW